MTTRSALLLLVVGLALFISSGDASVDFGYPNKCFFTVGKSSSGAWWFVDPSGNPFLSLGVTSVSWWGDASTTDATPYYDAVSAKFSNNQSAWADSVVSRLTSWKLNTLGAWADTVVITKGMPYTRILGVASGFGSWLAGTFPDVFDPAWEAATYDKAAQQCTPLRNDPNLIGYFLDNEVMWGPMLQGWADWRYPGTILDQMLTVYNKTAPGNVKAVAFLKSKYSTIQALNTAWNTTYASFDQISTRPLKSTPAHTNDSAAFTYLAAVQFFSVSRNAIKKYDPNHLLLGVKFAGAPSAPVLQACGEYNDVISLDVYPTSSEPVPSTSFMNQVYAYGKKPLLLAEFAFRGNDSGLPNTKGAGLVVPTQADRALGYKNYTTTLAKLPYVIGFHWFEWFDEPAEGRKLDGENSNYGLVTINDDTYTVLTNQMKTTNPQLNGLHGSSTGLASAKCVSALTCLNKCSGQGCCNTDTGVCKCNTGFSSADCSVDSSKLQVPSFSTVNTSVWSINNGGGWLSQTFSSAQTSTSSNQLKLAISPCTGSCSGFNFSAGGITTSSLYGYGIYTAEIKAPVSPGFTAQLEINSRSTPRDSMTLHVNAGRSVASLDYFGNGQYTYLKWINPLPFANASTQYHTYSIHYMPTYFAFYVDGILLGQYNSTTATAGLPSRSMAVWLYITADNTSPLTTDAMWVKSVSYTLVGGSTATCPASANGDQSPAGRPVSSVGAYLSSLFSSFGKWFV